MMGRVKSEKIIFIYNDSSDKSTNSTFTGNPFRYVGRGSRGTTAMLSPPRGGVSSVMLSPNLRLRGLRAFHSYRELGYHSLGCLLEVNTIVVAEQGTVPPLTASLRGYLSVSLSKKSQGNQP